MNSDDDDLAVILQPTGEGPHSYREVGLEDPSVSPELRGCALMAVHDLEAMHGSRPGIPWRLAEFVPFELTAETKAWLAENGLTDQGIPVEDATPEMLAAWRGIVQAGDLGRESDLRLPGSE